MVCVTAQHRQILDQVLTAFDVRPDFDLDLMRGDQSLAELTSRAIAGIAAVIQKVQPGMVAVQGDTTTALCAALTAFYAGVDTAHVEAGLRTFDLHAPFPEEMNRMFTARLASLHFAPTRWAADNLLREGIPAERIEVTGNTGIDAVLAIKSGLESGRLAGIDLPVDSSRKLIVVTAHRRESFGAGFERICEAVRRLAARGDVEIIWPVHPNPNVHGVVNRSLGNVARVLLMPPLDYVPFIDLLRRCYLIITDSGGIQEEAPSLGKPVLVLRAKTERPEGAEAGTVRLVGNDTEAIVKEAARLLDDPKEYAQMSHVHNPYGDGEASVRIALRIAKHLGVST